MILPEELHNHQVETVVEGVRRGRYGIHHDMGAGKTFTTITIMRNLFLQHKSPLKTLIICPDVVVDNWENEINKWSKCGRFVQTLKGPGKKRIEALGNDKKIFITNFEALNMEGLFWYHKVLKKRKPKVLKEGEEPPKKKKSKRRRYLVDHGFDILIVDESHRVKSHQASTTKILIRMADKIHYRFNLTGTPLPNDMQDIWSQFRVLFGPDMLGDKFRDFQRKYFVDENIDMPRAKHFPKWKLRIGAENYLTGVIARNSSRVLKADCMDLPPLIKSRILCGMGPAQGKAYKDMAKEAVAYIESHEEELEEGVAAIGQIALVKIMRLRQIASGFVTDDEGKDYVFKDVPKLKAISEYMQDIDHKYIIWATFKRNIEEISKVCVDLGKKFTLLTGAQSTNQKTANVAEFCGGDTDIIIANPAAGGTGINLTAAQTAIWYSYDYNAINRQQAEARNHRGGSEIHSKIFSIDLAVERSIDIIVLDKLQHKEDFAKSILDVKSKLKEYLKSA